MILYLFLLFLISGCNNSVLNSQNGNKAFSDHIEIKEKKANKAVVTVIEISNDKVLPSKTSQKTASQISSMSILKENPIPEFIPKWKWDLFLEHVKSGGKWILINYYHQGTRKQSFTAYEGSEKYLNGHISGASTDLDCRDDHHPDSPHNHLGLLWITHKNSKYWSKSYKCWMKYAMFYCNGNGHAIHACQKRDIPKLGNPASHGCIRTHPDKAKKLFGWVGNDRVEVLIVREKYQKESDSDIM